MSGGCEFCRIAAGETSAHRILETERVVAFLDENPAVDGYTLVVPTDHEEEVVTMAPETMTAVFQAVRRVALAMEAALDPDGFSLFHTTGSMVGSVDHAHVHLLPRRADDGVGIGLTREELTAAEGERTVALLREYL